MLPDLASAGCSHCVLLQVQAFYTITVVDPGRGTAARSTACSEVDASMPKWANSAAGEHRCVEGCYCYGPG